jgi:hypothetical protein
MSAFQKELRELTRFKPSAVAGAEAAYGALNERIGVLGDLGKLADLPPGEAVFKLRRLRDACDAATDFGSRAAELRDEVDNLLDSAEFEGIDAIEPGATVPATQPTATE